MGTSKPDNDLKRVTLSVGEHVYTCEIWRLSESRWVLLGVEVHGVGERSDLGIKAPSCLNDAFHPKGYIFRRGDEISAIIGSSNLSGSGLTSGRELNVVVDDAESVLNEFVRLWESQHAQPVTESVYERLERSRLPLEASGAFQKEDRVEEVEITEVETDEGEPVVVAPTNQGSIHFSFTINKSFMSYGQITVPRRVDYAKLEAEGFGPGRLHILFEGERYLSGLMRSANAGYGFYYQIVVQQDMGHPLFRLPIRTNVNVSLERSENGNVARIARA